jgi:predicted PurR-regulated permease PerM
MPSEDSPRRLTPNQWRLIGTALALISLTIIVAFCLGLFALFREFVTTFAQVLWPIAVSGVLALMLRPIVQIFQDRLKLSQSWAIIILYALATGAMLAALGLLLPTLVEQSIRFFNYLPTFIDKIRELAIESYPAIVAFIEEKLGADTYARIQESLSNSVESIVHSSESAINSIGKLIGKALAISTGLAIIPIYLFFMLESNRDLSKDIHEQLSFLKDDWRDDAVFLINEFVGSIVLFFRGQVAIALIMGVLLATGFTLIGLNFGIILGLGIGFLNIIPYLGSIIGIGTVLPLAYFQSDGGSLQLVIFALAIFTAVQMIEGYLLTPRIMGKSTGLHPMVIIIAIFFWGTALDGILGMILAIPLTAFFVVAWRLLKRKYLHLLKERAVQQ